MVSLGQDGFPEIQLVSGQHGGVDECTALHTQLVRIALKKILPPQLFEEALEDEVDREDFRAQLEEHMPLVATSRIGEAPCTVTFYMVQKARRNAFRFFMEMLGQWLVPGRTLPVPAINAVDFRFPGLGDQVYTYSQVAVSVDDADTLEQIRQNIPILRTELQLGAESAYYARRILEIKGLSPDEKTAMIQEHVGALLRKRPDQFDHRLFADMQHLLVNCSDDFKKARECRHICRIIGMGHVLRKQVQEEQERDPTRR
ncbi:MAG: hypothetical protein KDK78_11750, partial [Chlamydiia bacterium]|nr:hypothetical protein [Chlamydiia bacterium]